MNALIGRIFKIHKDEGLKVFHFILLGVLLEAGIAIGISLTDTLFLVNVGAEKLPIIYMIIPLVMIVFTPIYSYLVRRYGVDRVFNLSLIQLVIGGVLFFLLTYFPRFLGTASFLPIVFYIAKIYTFLWYMTLYTTYWNFIDGFFDILDAKRLFALFSGGLATGGMLGGTFVGFFTYFSGAESLFLVWSLIALLSIPLLRYMKKRWRKIEVEVTDVEEEKGFIEETRYVLKAIKNSRYLLLINFAVFSTDIYNNRVRIPIFEFLFSEKRHTGIDILVWAIICSSKCFQSNC